MKVYYQTDVGKVRPNNQDSVGGEVFENGAWAIVCDGMGGVGGGDIASRTAIDAVNSALAECGTQLIAEEVEDIIRSAAAKANKAVYSIAAENTELQGMGTTLVIALVLGDKLYTAHAGDSRAYLVENNSIHQLTKDHSVVQQMVDKGVISESEARLHPKKNIITRALGVNSFIDIDFAEYEYHHNGKILLCSDGLTNHLSGEDILGFFNEFSGQQLCSELINAANNAGGKDNISVAVICGE